jgi:hypothetical protein
VIAAKDDPRRSPPGDGILPHNLGPSKAVPREEQGAWGGFTFAQLDPGCVDCTGAESLAQLRLAA